jgi:hypothetical protein
MGAPARVSAASRLADRREWQRRIRLRSLRVPKESAASIATNVRYRNRATADPPNRTLAHLRQDGIVVWAVIFQARPGRLKPIRLDLLRARHLPCCEGAYVAGGVYELTGLGPQRAYSVIVRVYFGSRPTRVVRSQAQRALNRLQLPLPRWQTFRAARDQRPLPAPLARDRTAPDARDLSTADLGCGLVSTSAR